MRHLRPRKRDSFGRPLPLAPKDDKGMTNFLGSISLTEFHKAIEEMNDPRFARLAVGMSTSDKTIPELIRECDITLMELYEFWGKRRKVQGLLRMVEHAPVVMEDVALDAKSRVLPCPTCHEKGTVKGERCLTCGGEKTVRVPGDNKARDIFFEALGLVGKPLGPLVSLSISDGASLEEMIGNAQKIITVHPQVAESEKGKTQ